MTDTNQGASIEEELSAVLIGRFKIAFKDHDIASAREILQRAKGIQMERARRGTRYLDEFLVLATISRTKTKEDIDFLRSLIDPTFVSNHHAVMHELIDYGQLHAVQSLIEKKPEGLDWSSQNWIQRLIKKWKESSKNLNADEVIDIILMMVERKTGILYERIESNPEFEKNCPVSFLLSLSYECEKDDVLIRMVRAFISISHDFALNTISDAHNIFAELSNYNIKNQKDAIKVASLIEYLRENNNDYFKDFYAMFFSNYSVFFWKTRSPEIIAQVIERCGEVSGRKDEHNLEVFEESLQLIRNNINLKKNKENQNIKNYREALQFIKRGLEIKKITNIKVETGRAKKFSM